MEKKRNQIARSGQNSSDFKTKSDVSNKQFPKQQKRRESSHQTSENNKSQSSKNRSTNFYDKRPQRRNTNLLNDDKSNTSSTSSCSSTGLMEDAAELNSVFNHGSKKQNLNHLLNFHYYNSKDNDVIRSGTFAKHGYHRLNHSKRYNFNKEQYLQANCQFVVKADTGFDYRPFKISPDNLVQWDQVVKILVSSVEEAQCPICLYPPKAAKMTRCGHIYCSSCILHYLSLSDKSWRKCPICYESIHHPDLKSTSSKNNHRSYKVGDTISMQLLKREKGSLFVVRACENDVTEFPSMSLSDSSSAKLIMADHEEILRIIAQEENELEFQMIEDGVDCPESVFIQQAMELLKVKRAEIEDDMKRPMEIKVKRELNPTVAEYVPLAKQESVTDAECHESSRNQLIEDSNLTVNDIDIAPEHLNHFFFYQAPNAQNIFLHSINSRVLQEMYGSLDKAPHEIHGKILQIESCTMDQALRKRLKYLNHLPLASVFEVVEIEFERDFIPINVVDKFRDELLHRRKMRQRREREEKKHEKSINEINDRQMGKFIKSVASMNVNIDSMQQFPGCGIDDMPALPSTSPTLSSSPAAGPSFANMLTTPKSKKSQNLWPSLSMPSTSTAGTSSFFEDKKIAPITGNKIAKPQPVGDKESGSEEDDDEEEEKFKSPSYHQLGDMLATALESKLAKQMQFGTSKGGKKKKTKKTLLFASGMNFN